MYGFSIAGGGGDHEESVYDRSMLGLLQTLYSSFDTLNEDRMDWRCFLFMVRTAQPAPPPLGHACALTT